MNRQAKAKVPTSTNYVNVINKCDLIILLMAQFK
jgi:hypothetical protein